MRVKLGIDLGTSNVVAAYMRGDTLFSYDWGELGQGFLLPAFVQSRAEQILTGRLARSAWERGEPGCYWRFKMNIGRDNDQSPVRAEQLMTYLAETVRRSILGSATHISEISDIESAVITVPHGWKENQRRATQAAVQAAGIPVTRLVSEPVAAAAYYAYVRKPTTSETVLVCDMGGGTFDITLTEIQPGRKIRVVEHGTATNEAAGTYTDALIAAHILSTRFELRLDAESLLRDQDSTEIRSLLRSVEKARLDLNDAAVERVRAGQDTDDLEPADVRLSHRDQRHRHELTYEEMVSLMRPVCDQAKQSITSLLASLPQWKPQGVVLAGGMSKMLAVQEAIADATGTSAETLRSFGQESDRAIARGAALVAEDKVQIDEVLPYGLGVIAQDYDKEEREINVIVLPRGTSVPCRRASLSSFRTVNRRTQTLLLKIGLGDSEDPAECDVITIDLEAVDALPRGTNYRFVFSVDENQLLTVEAQRENADSQFVTIPLRNVSRGPLQLVKSPDEGA